MLAVSGCDRVFGIRELHPDAPGTHADALFRFDGGVFETTVAIIASEDDAMEDPGGPMLVKYAWMSLYSADHWGALRFELANVPQGARIRDAYIEVVVDSVYEADPALVITSQATSTPAQFTESAFDISSRRRGTAGVDWYGQKIGEGYQRSPSLAPIVQERVDDTTWTTSSAIVFLLDAQATSTFELRQFDAGSFANAPRLTVQFTMP